MDLSVFFNNHHNFDTTLDLGQIEALRVNTDRNRVLCRVYFGRWSAGEIQPMEDAFRSIIIKYKEANIEVIFELFNNDLIFNNQTHDTKTPHDVIMWLLESDIHLLPTLLHQNCLARGSTGVWTMREVTGSILRLENHLGLPCGQNVGCPLLTQNIALIYTKLLSLGLCAPFILVSIEETELNETDHDHISR
jgi:hypothetical protein